MKVLFVTLVEAGSGETITALHMAEKITERGGKVFFLASAFARRFIKEKFPNDILEFTNDGDWNRAAWDASLRDFRPDGIVFADYPLLFLASGTCPLSDKDEWVRSLAEVDACLITLDHTGFAQQGKGMFFGPPHLSFHYEKWPAIPEQMHVLLPCPMNEPSPLAWRKGRPFRYWDLPLTMQEEQRQKIRQRYLEHEEDYLIFHSIPNWAWQIAQGYGLPYHLFLPEILEYYFADLPKPVTVISVNKGDILKQPAASKIRIINLSSLSKTEYEALLFSSDLMITENKVSISMGKAMCGLLPCVVLNNSYRYRDLLRRLKGKLRQIVTAMEKRRPGAVYPYEIFPQGTEELEQLGLYHDNSITRGFRELEIYGEEETRHELHRLLTDKATLDAFRAEQYAYVDKVQRLDDADDVLRRLIEGRENEHE